MTSSSPGPRRPKRLPQEDLCCHYATHQVEQAHLLQPEFRLELIEGKLHVGGSLAGSQWLLREALLGWGLEAAIAFAPLDAWWSALRTAYEVNCHTPEDWLCWAEAWKISDDRKGWPPLGSRYMAEHDELRDRLRQSLSKAVAKGSLGQCFGPHYGLWIGDQVLTPDIQMVEDLRLIENPCFDRYLQGPAHLVVEVVWPEWAQHDTQMRKQHYEKAKIPHYWTVDPLKQTVQFWQWSPEGYELRSPDADGCYRGVSGLSFTPEFLWESDTETSQLPLITSLRHNRPWQLIEQESEDGIPWDGIPFKPRVSLDPIILTPEEFLAWCPEAKLETGPLIGGSEWGTRNTLAMLLMSLGLVQAVQLMPGYEWVRVLRRVEREQQQDAQRRSHWLAEAKAIAQSLHEEYHIGGIGLIGDLLCSQPLNRWSEVHLMLWEIPKGFSTWQVQHLTEVPIRMTRVQSASPADWQAVEQDMTVLVGQWCEQEQPKPRKRQQFQWCNPELKGT